MRRSVCLLLLVLLAVLLVSSTFVKVVLTHDADEIKTTNIQVDTGLDDDDDDDDADLAVPPAAAVTTQQQPELQAILNYLAPKPNGSFVFFENFNEDFANQWVVSKDSKYTGEWKWATAQKLAGIESDKGLLAPLPARHYGIMASISPPIDNTDKDEFVVQYEVKLQDKLECGGAYIKLLLADPNNPTAPVRDDSPYAIMFGPDKCGSNNKVHFIFRHQNPKTGEWQEKHMTGAPTIRNDQKTHLYTLVVRKDNSFEVFIDGKSARKGSLLEDFAPAVNPPKEIDDPSDVKPEDWVDEAKIPDPTATKPEDWNEAEPLEIDDPNDVKPDSWLDDEPENIPDPEAKKPDTWDDDEDGEWEGPLIPNPKCEESGCGVWSPRKIRNPRHKGKWVAPLIDNPAYKGPWKARQIPNPDYFEDLHPHNFPKIGAVAIEIWTMQGNILFDNFIITHDYDVAKQYGEATWGLKFARETEKEPKDADNKDVPATDLISNYFAMLTPYILQIQAFLEKSSTSTIATLASVFVGLPLLFAGLCWCCVRPSPKKSVKTTGRIQKSKPVVAPQEKDAAEEEEEEEEAEAEREKSQEDESGEQKKAKKDNPPATSTTTETSKSPKPTSRKRRE